MNMVQFLPYQVSYKKACLSLFDDNSPEFFTPNEREDYCAFLELMPSGYEVCMISGNIVGAFGLFRVDNMTKSLNWILLSSTSQGVGIGRQVMNHIKKLAQQTGIESVTIAASHLSAPFFAKFDAQAINEIKDGWGQGMHRIDMVMSV